MSVLEISGQSYWVLSNNSLIGFIESLHQTGEAIANGAFEEECVIRLGEWINTYWPGKSFTMDEVFSTIEEMEFWSRCCGELAHRLFHREIGNDEDWQCRQIGFAMYAGSQLTQWAGGLRKRAELAGERQDETSENDDQFDERTLDEIAEGLGSEDPETRAQARNRFADSTDEPDLRAENPEISDQEIKDQISGSKLMVKVLRERVAPRLRKRGFRGRHPHFRRFLPHRVDLLTFQMNKAGESFCVEIGCCSPGGYRPKEGDLIPAEKVTPWDLEPRERLRLGLKRERGLLHRGIKDKWFIFRDWKQPGAQEGCERAADEALAAILDEGERWWNRPRSGVKARLRDLWHG